MPNSANRSLRNVAFLDSGLEAKPCKYRTLRPGVNIYSLVVTLIRLAAFAQMLQLSKGSFNFLVTLPNPASFLLFGSILNQ
jgi:hypothetical protein